MKKFNKKYFSSGLKNVCKPTKFFWTLYSELNVKMKEKELGVSIAKHALLITTHYIQGPVGMGLAVTINFERGVHHFLRNFSRLTL